MIYTLSQSAAKRLKKLPRSLQNKFFKQMNILLADPRHPSLRVKKLARRSDAYEAKIDYHYRFAYERVDGTINILSLGPHDEGLGKK